MKAITIHQPWASLMVTPNSGPLPPLSDTPKVWTPTVKWIETRSWPAPAGLISQTVAIHASAKRPNDVWQNYTKDPEWSPALAPFYDFGKYVDAQESGDGDWWRYRWVGPLGAVVGSGVLKACVPMTFPNDEPPDGPFCYVDSDWIQIHDGIHDPAPIYDETQLPYGDFRPGRWAWLFDDLAPTSERCPVCRGDGKDGRVPLNEWPEACPVCGGAGKCEPIPARGRQRIWNWNPEKETA